MTTLHRSPQVAFVDRDNEDTVVTAGLPDGPIQVLEGPTAVVWRLLEEPRALDELVQLAVSLYPDAPESARSDITAMVGQMVEAGLLVEG